MMTVLETIDGERRPPLDGATGHLLLIRLQQLNRMLIVPASALGFISQSGRNYGSLGAYRSRRVQLLK